MHYRDSLILQAYDRPIFTSANASGSPPVGQHSDTEPLHASQVSTLFCSDHDNGQPGYATCVGCHFLLKHGKSTTINTLWRVLQARSPGLTDSTCVGPVNRPGTPRWNSVTAQFDPDLGKYPSLDLQQLSSNPTAAEQQVYAQLATPAFSAMCRAALLVDKMEAFYVQSNLVNASDPELPMQGENTDLLKSVGLDVAIAAVANSTNCNGRIQMVTDASVMYGHAVLGEDCSWEHRAAYSSLIVPSLWADWYGSPVDAPYGASSNLFLPSSGTALAWSYVTKDHNTVAAMQRALIGRIRGSSWREAATLAAPIQVTAIGEEEILRCRAIDGAAIFMAEAASFIAAAPVPQHCARAAELMRVLMCLHDLVDYHNDRHNCEPVNAVHMIAQTTGKSRSDVHSRVHAAWSGAPACCDAVAQMARLTAGSIVLHALHPKWGAWRRKILNTKAGYMGSCSLPSTKRGGPIWLNQTRDKDAPLPPKTGPLAKVCTTLASSLRLDQPLDVSFDLWAQAYAGFSASLNVTVGEAEQY